VLFNKKNLLDISMLSCIKYLDIALRENFTFKYVLLKNFNDSAKKANEIIKLIKDVSSEFNLMLFSLFSKNEYKPTKKIVKKCYQEIFMDADIFITIKQTRGYHIYAAYGQLVGCVQDKTKKIQRLQFT